MISKLMVQECCTWDWYDHCYVDNGTFEKIEWIKYSLR